MLIVASLGASGRDAALCGFLHGLVFYPACLTWIYTVLRDYGNLSVVEAAGVPLLIGVAGGLFSAVFTAAIARAGRRSLLHACLLAPPLWVAIEFAKAHLPYIGFPWNLAGYAAAYEIALLQIVTITGIYGLSFLVAVYNSLVAWTAIERSPRSAISLASVTAILMLAAIAGARFVPRPVARHIAHLVQTNFPQSESYPANWMEIHSPEMEELERVSVEAAHASPGFIVWPEVPAPFSFQDVKFAERAQRIARDSGNEFLVGVVDWRQDKAGNWDASNSATLLSPQGARSFTYDKVHLVPFGEYVPLRPWLFFAHHLIAEISDFTPGKEYSAGSLPGGRFGVFICYEAIFPDEVRRFTKRGAGLLINISNDGWFGRSAAPLQHVMMARVRAVENRRWLLRDTNNGYTVSVDPYGRIVAALAPDIRSQLDAPYEFRTDLTFYTRWGDWLAWVCVVASAVLMALGFARSARVS